MFKAAAPSNHKILYERVRLRDRFEWTKTAVTILRLHSLAKGHGGHEGSERQNQAHRGLWARSENGAIFVQASPRLCQKSTDLWESRHRGNCSRLVYAWSEDSNPFCALINTWTFWQIFEPWTIRDVIIKGKTTRDFDMKYMQKILDSNSRHAQRCLERWYDVKEHIFLYIDR